MKMDTSTNPSVQVAVYDASSPAAAPSEHPDGKEQGNEHVFITHEFEPLTLFDLLIPLHH